jgi:hypothetical protein
VDTLEINQKSEKKKKDSDDNYPSSSEQFSKQAVLNNKNALKEGISHQRVRGFKLRNQVQAEEVRDFNIKLTDDILFQGLNSEDLKKAYQAAQKFSSDYRIIRYLIDDSL